MIHPFKYIKQILPRSFFGRSLIILTAPLIIVQAILVFIFYDRHTETVLRMSSTAIAGDVQMVADFFDIQKNFKEVAQRANRNLMFQLSFEPHKRLKRKGLAETSWLYGFMEDALNSIVKYPYYLKMTDGYIYLDVEHPKGVLHFVTTRKRLFSRTTKLVFIATMTSALLLLIIASLFMHNQIRSLRRLADAAEKFGTGQDVDSFKPEGATEIRTAGRAFNIMRERIRRQINERMEMLAGVSHDLRTPLTRMKLQLAMMKNSPQIQNLQEDVDQMQKMVEGFLDFSRGVGEEEVPQEVNFKQFIEKVLSQFQETSLIVSLACAPDITIFLKQSLFNRCLTNLLLNSQRYAHHAWVSVVPKSFELLILVDDDGPGIPSEEREEVFRPFYRPDSSRNTDTGGVGLGLSIARDVVLNHGGSIKLMDSPYGGLRVEIRLPQ